MNGTEGLAYGALFVLAIALLLMNHLILAVVAIVPLVLTSFKYSFPQQKKPSVTARPKKKSNHEVIIS